MPYIDIPAVNVTTPASFPATVVGGGSALSSTDTDTYVEGVWSGGQNFRVGDGTPGTGFGLATVPDGVTVTSVQMVAYGYRSGGADDVFNTAWEEDGEAYPTLAYTYINDPWPGGNYNVGPLPIGEYGWADSTIPSTQWKYVLAGHPDAPSGFAGLSPEYFIGPTDTGPFPRPALTVRVAYVAIRVNYDAPSAPSRLRHRPLRQHPRSDGLGTSAARRLDGDRAMQSTLRRGGGVYF